MAGIKNKKVSSDELAQVFATEYRDVLSWRVRQPNPGEPHCWFVHGRLDEFGIATLDLARAFLRDHTLYEPQRFGRDATDERVYEMLERAKKKLMVR